MSYKSDDVYISQEGEQYRIHYNEEQKAYHTEVKKIGSLFWLAANSSYYPLFSNACGEFDAWIRRENLKKQEDSECENSTSDRSTLDTDSESQPAAEAPDASPADVESAMSIRPDAEAASLAPVFDFGADEETNLELTQCAQMFFFGRVQQCMAAKRAHNKTANHYQGCFGKWCETVGISRDTGNNLVSVADNFGNVKLDGKPLIEITQFSLLSAAAKPSAPAELVAQVKSGDITTNKQFQEAIAAKKAAEEAQRAAEAERDKIAKEKAEQAKQLEASRGLVKTRNEEIEQLRRENRELEKRPVSELLPPDPEEIDRIVKEKVGHIWEQNVELKRELEPKEPTPEDRTDAYARIARFTGNVIDQWNAVKNGLSIMLPEAKEPTKKTILKMLQTINEEVEEY